MVQAMLYAGHWNGSTDQDQELSLSASTTDAIALNGATAITVTGWNAVGGINAYVSVDATFETGARTGGADEGAPNFIHVRIDTDDPPATLYFSQDSGIAGNLNAVRHYSERE